MELDTKYFRAGVGTVIYNNDGKVAWFERAYHPIGIWQFQQGGIDSGESTETTLWRELKEEVGLEKEDFTDIQEYPTWTVHAYDKKMLDHAGPGRDDRLGQIHRWFFLKLKDSVEIDLKNASTEEFANAQWTDWEAAIANTHESKQPVYKELHAYFVKNIAS